MAGTLVLRVVAVVGFVTVATAGSVSIYRHLPTAYPRARTRLDARTYRIVRTAVAIGVVVGALGAVLSLVDTVGSLRAVEGRGAGLLAGLAILLPARVGTWMVRVGVGLLAGGGLLAGTVELRNVRR